MGNAADMNVLGNLFGDAKEGFQFGYGVKTNMEDRKRQQQQQAQNLAMAQQKAEFERQKLGNDQRRLNLQETGQNNEMTRFNQGLTEKGSERAYGEGQLLTGKFKTPQGALAFNQLTPEQRKDPAELQKIYDTERQLEVQKENDKVSTATRKEKVKTGEFIARQPYRVSETTLNKADGEVKDYVKSTHKDVDRMRTEGQSEDNIKKYIQSREAVIRGIVNNKNLTPGNISAVNVLRGEAGLQLLPSPAVHGVSPAVPMQPGTTPVAAPVAPSTSTPTAPPSPVAAKLILDLKTTKPDQIAAAIHKAYPGQIPPEDIAALRAAGY